MGVLHGLSGIAVIIGIPVAALVAFARTARLQARRHRAGAATAPA